MREPMAEPPTDPEWRQERVRDSAGHDDRYNGPLGIFEQMDDGDEDEDYRLTSDGGPDDYGMVTCTCFGGLCPANGTCPDDHHPGSRYPVLVPAINQSVTRVTIVDWHGVAIPAHFLT